MKTCLATLTATGEQCTDDALYRIRAECPSGHRGNSRACAVHTAEIRHNPTYCDACFKAGTRAVLTVISVATGRAA